MVNFILYRFYHNFKKRKKLHLVVKCLINFTKKMTCIKGEKKRKPHSIELKRDKNVKSFCFNSLPTLYQLFSSPSLFTYQAAEDGKLEAGRAEGSHNLGNRFHHKFTFSNLGGVLRAVINPSPPHYSAPKPLPLSSYLLLHPNTLKYT